MRQQRWVIRDGNGVILAREGTFPHAKQTARRLRGRSRTVTVTDPTGRLVMTLAPRQ